MITNKGLRLARKVISGTLQQVISLNDVNTLHNSHLAEAMFTGSKE